MNYEQGTLDERGPYDIIDKEGNIRKQQTKRRNEWSPGAAWNLLIDLIHPCIHHRPNLAALGVLVHVNNLLQYRTDLLVTRVFRTENVHATLPSNDAAAIAHNFDGWADFHASGEGRCYSREKWGSGDTVIREYCLGLGQSCPWKESSAGREQRPLHDGGADGGGGK
jgi:hypothetical protein